MTKLSLPCEQFQQEFWIEDCIMTENAVNNPHNQANWPNPTSILSHTVEDYKMVVFAQDSLWKMVLFLCPGWIFQFSPITWQWLIRGTGGHVSQCTCMHVHSRMKTWPPCPLVCRKEPCWECQGDAVALREAVKSIFWDNVSIGVPSLLPIEKIKLTSPSPIPKSQIQSSPV